jgi:5-methylthioadenosine/S-adenosylhomocysteine deaminase
MKNTALLQKAWRRSPAEMPLDELFACATEHGAKALGINTGVIREGAYADLSLVDINNSYFLSPGSVKANLVYAAHSDVISSVMVKGKWVMRDRHVPGEEEILEGARRVLSQI